MKKPVSAKALAREASYWSTLKKALREDPSKVCLK